jgi:hypothetical protein
MAKCEVPGFFDLVVVNDDLDDAFVRLKGARYAFAAAACLRTRVAHEQRADARVTPRVARLCCSVHL